MKNEKGITLIALIITIIVMLILVAVIEASSHPALRFLPRTPPAPWPAVLRFGG